MVVRQHFHDRDRCFLFDFPVMVIVSRFTRYCKDNICYITGTEKIPCPVCGGCLFVHGTCRRKVKDETEQVQELRLRVLECEACGHTHRELPEELVPYKRYSAEAICQIREQPEICAAEPTVRQRILLWLSWFFCYARNVACAQRLQGLDSSEPSGVSLCRRLMYFVRLVVNAGFWEQHRSVMTRL